MAPLSYSYYSSSPVLALPRQHAPHHFVDAMASSSPFTQTSPFDHASFATSPPRISSKPIMPITTNLSRKRSRDETLSPVDAQPASSYFDLASTRSPSNATAINGVNATLNQPPKSSISQTNHPEHSSSSPDHSRQVITPRKSQRLDLAASSNSAPTLSAGSPPKSAVTDPFANDFTLVLGVGWTRLSDDESMQAAARGWAKYIENHYPVSNATIQLQSKGLNSYLVRATQGFFLFSEDLSEGRFVGDTWEKAVPNLQARPVVFEGEVLKAVRSPGLQPAKSDGPSVVHEQSEVVADGHHAMDLD